MLQTVDYVSPSPVFTIDHQMIVEAGTSTLSDYLNQLPQFNPFPDSTGNNPAFGIGGTNFRNLGANRSLVLIDGQRVGSAGLVGAVDLNQMPYALIDQVEVLTGGASSVYGSDAMGGVVNIKTKNDHRGLSLDASYQITDRGDGESNTIDLVWGGDTRLGQWTLIASRTDRGVVHARDRGFSEIPLVDDFSGGLIYGGDRITPSGSIPASNFFSNDGVVFEPDGDVRTEDVDDYFNFHDFTYLQTGMERTNLGVWYATEIGTTELAVKFNYSNRDIETRLAPTPFSSPAAQFSLDSPFLSDQASQLLSARFDPEGTGVYRGPFAYRVSGLGPRNRTDELEDLRLSIQLDGELGQWQWQINAIRYDFERDDVEENRIAPSRLLQSLNIDPATGNCVDSSGGCVAGNFFGEGNLSQAALEFIRLPDIVNQRETDMSLINWTMNREFELYGRQIPILGGLEYRKEHVEARADPLLAIADRFGRFFLGLEKSDFRVAEAFGEILLPLLDSDRQHLNLELGARYSDYDTFGGFPSWKIGLVWEPHPNVLIRASQQRAVRAPNLQELAPPAEPVENFFAFFSFVPDFCSADRDPVGAGLSDVCIAQGIAPGDVGVFVADNSVLSTIQPGANSLEQEDADTLTLGATFQTKGGAFALAVDYYDIEIDNAINSIGRDDVIQTCFELADPGSEVCQAIRRDTGGDITLVRTGRFNASLFRSTGVDISARARFDEIFDGALQLDLIANKVLKDEFKLVPQSVNEDCLGSYGFPCPSDVVPEYRANLSVTYSKHNFRASIRWRWIDGLENGLILRGPPFPLAVPGTDSFNYVDLSAGYEFANGISLAGTLVNLTDKLAPILGSNSQQNNTYPQLFDPIGRRYELRMNYRF